MPSRFRSVCFHLALCCLPLTAPAPAGSAGVEVLRQPNPLGLEWLSVPDSTKTCLRSGFDFKDGNVDSGNLLRIEPAGRGFQEPDAVWVLFDAAGPGAITSIWLTGKNRQGKAGIGGRLNFFFDGEEQPSLSGELPGVFEAGEVFLKPLAEKSSGGWVCYAPIFFARSLKITLTGAAASYVVRTNSLGQAIPHLYHQLSYQSLKGPVQSSTAASLRRTAAWSRPAPRDPAARTLDLAPGESRVVAGAAGTGIVQSLRLRFESGDPDAARLRIRADGQTLVDLRVPEFWGFSRQARPGARLDSALLAVGQDGTYASYWPMPHRGELKVELVNGPAPARVRVELDDQPGWPQPEHLHFHAERVTDTTEPGRDIKLLEVAGRGHYAGSILEMANATLEGDDRFQVDGEPFPPAWHGTGTEDYFRCGWYFTGGALTRPVYGLLDNAVPKIAYRFHVADRVNFTRSVVIGFEHGHHNRYRGPYSGTVFWYGERAEPGKP